MKCEKLPIDDCRDGQLVKHFHHGIVALSIVQSEHLLPEIVTLRALSRLVIASKEKYSIRVAHFKAKQESDNFWLILTPIYIVTHKYQLLVRPAKLYLAQNLH